MEEYREVYVYLPYFEKRTKDREDSAIEEEPFVLKYEIGQTEDV